MYCFLIQGLYIIQHAAWLMHNEWVGCWCFVSHHLLYGLIYWVLDRWCTVHRTIHFLVEFFFYGISTIKNYFTAHFSGNLHQKWKNRYACTFNQTWSLSSWFSRGRCPSLLHQWKSLMGDLAGFIVSLPFSSEFCSRIQE